MTKTNPTQDTTTADAAVTVVENLNPADLLIDVNIRHDDRLDPDFLASIAALGVLVPIVGVRTPKGAVRVRYGHRRTAAAVAGGVPTVPVVVAADEATDDEATVARLVAQHAENTHRAGLTTTEEVDVVAQLSLLGVSAHQITKRTRIKRDQVDAALTVAGSNAAKTGLTHFDLDLTQAATLADFEDDDEAQAALIEAARRGPGAFNHAAQRARDDRSRAAARADFTATLINAGHTVVDTNTGTPLNRLVDADRHDVTAENHATCPGHAARVEIRHGYVDPTTGRPPVKTDTTDADTTDADTTDADTTDADSDADDEWGDEDDADDANLVWNTYPDAVWVCTDPETHGHQGRYGTNTSGGYGEPRRKVADMNPAEAAEARAARRDVIESNKAWKAAEPVRREWVRSLLTRKTPPTGASAFTATALTVDRFLISGQKVSEVAADLLGTTSPAYGYGTGLTEMIEKASAKRCEVIALGLLLAAYEANTTGDHWRTVNHSTARYLRFLDACGYERSNVERRATGDDPIPEDADPAAYAGE